MDSIFRSLWIAEEKELVHEIAGLGELRDQWHTSQMSWLDGHLNLINTYNTNLENTDNYRGMRDIHSERGLDLHEAKSINIRYLILYSFLT